MSSMQSRKLDGTVIVENLINENELKYIHKLISEIPSSMNSADLLENGHKEFHDELYVNAIAIGSFLQNHYKINLNFTGVYPPFFRKTSLNHETEIHADNETLDGCVKQGCENFDVSAVLYFNENFIGGELYFPNQNIKVSPRAGCFIAFPGDARYAHGVLPIAEGIRYSAPMWFAIID